jgi:hypothetical protein
VLLRFTVSALGAVLRALCDFDFLPFRVAMPNWSPIRGEDPKLSLKCLVRFRPLLVWPLFESTSQSETFVFLECLPDFLECLSDWLLISTVSVCAFLDAVADLEDRGEVFALKEKSVALLPEPTPFVDDMIVSPLTLALLGGLLFAGSVGPVRLALMWVLSAE